MIRDAAATQQRLLDAATQEFSEHGIAGARVDRIAVAAETNKAQIYHYFGSKDALFDAVLEAIVTRTAGKVPIDVEDLPGYAGRLFDQYEKHPEICRLATWYRLERKPTDSRVEALSSTIADELDQLGKAQTKGTLSARYSPAELLNLVLHLSFLWAFVYPELQGTLARTSRTRRRDVLVDAVTQLVEDGPRTL